jgi:lysozyme family protein
VQVPKGRPLRNLQVGEKAYTFEESAVDALLMKDLDKKTNWTIGKILERFENYNGTGYREYHPSVNTPYLWSGTNHYIKGKYVKDGKYDSNAVSKQIGVAILIKKLAAQ